MVSVRIPGPLRPVTADLGRLEIEAATVGETLRALIARHPTLAPHLFDDKGRLHPFVNAFLNQVDVRVLGSEATPVAAADELVLVPSIAGG